MRPLQRGEFNRAFGSESTRKVIGMGLYMTTPAGAASYFTLAVLPSQA